MAELAVGVDGGNSKTDVVVATAAGQILARLQGPGTHPDVVGVPATATMLAELTASALERAGAGPGDHVGAWAGCLANVDTRPVERALTRELTGLGLAAHLEVHNDTFAVLWAGAPEGWGVAVACGAGVNAVGVHPDGRVARFLGLGDISGDWGGGYCLGTDGLGAAVRAGDGRGPGTALRRVLPPAVGLSTPEAVAVAVMTGRLARSALLDLAPVVLACAADGDPVARRIADRQADEVAVMVVAALRRLRLLRRPAPVVLGGGTMQNAPAILLDRLRDGVTRWAPSAGVRVLGLPPVAGALDRSLVRHGAGPAERRRARDELGRREP
ncbi:MAG: hypothetical protein QG622_2108 [Actinomycetota bacterium]|nr:hypothetical protein [Actinomycetota bacterium]